MRQQPYIISRNAASDDFPPLESALEFPDGLLAIGGDLTVDRLIVAYRRGIFPWYNETDPILWWSPAQRLVLLPDNLRVSRSLRKTIRKGKFTVTMNQSFRAVIEACAGPRITQNGTWINEEMQDAYTRLHQHGFAHSVECWHEGKLVGGLYGITLGKVFFGESMFSLMTDASKVAFAHFVWQLKIWGYELIDCQVESQHLVTLGAATIPRQTFRALLDRFCELPGHQGAWQFDLV